MQTSDIHSYVHERLFSVGSIVSVVCLGKKRRLGTPQQKTLCRKLSQLILEWMLHEL